MCLLLQLLNSASLLVSFLLRFKFRVCLYLCFKGSLQMLTGALLSNTIARQEAKTSLYGGVLGAGIEDVAIGVNCNLQDRTRTCPKAGYEAW